MAGKPATGIGARLRARYAAEPVPPPMPPPPRGVEHRSSRIRSQMAQTSRIAAPVSMSLQVPAAERPAPESLRPSKPKDSGAGGRSRVAEWFLAAAALSGLAAWVGLRSGCWDAVVRLAQIDRTPQAVPDHQLPYVTSKPMIAGTWRREHGPVDKAGQGPDRIVLGKPSRDNGRTVDKASALDHR